MFFIAITTTLYVLVNALSLSQEEAKVNRELIISAKNGDRRARESLLESFDGMIRAVAAEYSAKLDEAGSYDDILQSGRVGFLEALDRFDFSIAPAFIPYVKEGVRMAIRDYLNTSLRLIKLPKSAIHSAKLLSGAMKKLEEDGCSCHDRDAIKRVTGFSDVSLRNAERNRKLQMPLSLDYSYEDGDSSISLSIPSDVSVEEEAENDVMIQRLSAGVASLADDDRFIINSFYGAFGSAKLRVSEIAARLSVSAGTVRNRVRLIEVSLYRMIS